MDALSLLAIAKKKFSISQINDDFISRLIFSSLSFESDRVTKEEVDKILSSDFSNVQEYKIKLVLNHYQAFKYIINLAENKINFDEDKLKDIHEKLLEGFGIGGLYRNVNISINGSEHTPPSYEKVRDRMKQYFEDLYTQADPFHSIAYSHLQLAKIHPFLDGNGRCARLVLNYSLMKYGYCPIIIPCLDKERYFQSLEAYKVSKDMNPFIDLIKNLEIEYLNNI